MPQIIVEKRFGYNEPDKPHPDWYDPGPNPVEVSEACARCAVTEGWARPVEDKTPGKPDGDGSPTGQAKQPASSQAEAPSPKRKPGRPKGAAKR